MFTLKLVNTLFRIKRCTVKTFQTSTFKVNVTWMPWLSTYLWSFHFKHSNFWYQYFTVWSQSYYYSEQPWAKYQNMPWKLDKITPRSSVSNRYDYQNVPKLRFFEGENRLVRICGCWNYEVMIIHLIPKVKFICNALFLLSWHMAFRWNTSDVIELVVRIAYKLQTGVINTFLP